VLYPLTRESETGGSMKKIFMCAFFVMINSIIFSESVMDKLEQLKMMMDKGLITETEFVSTKKRLLAEFSTNKKAVKASPVVELPVENLIAVIPYFGKVYSDGDRDTMAKFTVQNLKKYIANKEYKFKHGVLEFHLSKNILADDMKLIDPGEPYSESFLAKAAEILKVRYLFFGNIHHYSWEPALYRFNVDCMVYDYVKRKIVFTKTARQSSARKLFGGFVGLDKGKTIGKITEQFYFFIDNMSANSSLQSHPFTDNKKSAFKKSKKQSIIERFRAKGSLFK
jgi:hypothetical protein